MHYILVAVLQSNANDLNWQQVRRTYMPVRKRLEHVVHENSMEDKSDAIVQAIERRQVEIIAEVGQRLLMEGCCNKRMELGGEIIRDMQCRDLDTILQKLRRRLSEVEREFLQGMYMKGSVGLDFEI
ncbi:hypothetical protein DPMN_089377 [Dreissena polymorpha]|uniref:Uncharacterized protein n=1 Tax=Dreissena polymorpha TaxID=45954 RepID=A0A9D4QYT1_DREPO|nr:hypothetical protein DPMN_089377 [Dreissena polymorpha]